MSFVTTELELLAAAAGELHSTGAALSAENAAAAAPPQPAWFQLWPTRYPR